MSRRKPPPPMEATAVAELFTMDAEGRIFWKNTMSPRAKAGQEAGRVDPDGYRTVKVRYRTYKAHRIVWAIIHGRWPAAELDHINRVRDDNRPENLREATPRQNQGNKSISSNNTSGFKGVSWYSPSKKWRAFITLDRWQKSLGLFDTPEAASAAYQAAARSAFGQFATSGQRGNVL